jgi:hypothetical protein
MIGRVAMPISLQIQCVMKSDGPFPHERIKKIGGVRCDGKRWRRTQTQAVRDIETATFVYWVDVPGKGKVDVILAESRTGKRYIKTTVDEEHPNVLLALPESL